MIHRIEQRKLRLLLEVSGLELFVSILATTSTTAAAYLSYAISNSPFTTASAPEAFHFRTLSFFLGLVFLHAHDIAIRGNRTFREMIALNSALHSQYSQFHHSEATIDAINIRYHDLKHRLTELRNASESTREQEIAEIEGLIDDYNSTFDTGSPVLDTILTSAALRGRQYSITLTGVVDGTLLSHVKAIDLSSIFGNALDNAIEAARSLTDANRRLIHVTATRTGAFCLVCFYNLVDFPVDTTEGLPKTTKNDPDGVHGFGLKSIQATAERLGGAMTIHADEERFELRILLPLIQP